jgi:ribose/xylose/arabinose/galactoside ABC-type transport system permease subunit
MSNLPLPKLAKTLLRAAPLTLLALVWLGFGSMSPQFLTLTSLTDVLVQSSWLMVVALGMSFVLLTGGVDLSVGSAMYLTAVAIGLEPAATPVWLNLATALAVGALFGAFNGCLIARLKLPAFVVTLSTLFIARGLGLLLSSTRMMYPGPALAQFGRTPVLGIMAPAWMALVAIGGAWVIQTRTSFGVSMRSIGADAEGARRAGVPISPVIWGVYILCGALAGLGSLILLAETAAASSAYGQNSEFLAIAAAVLGGTSLFGGRGTLWAPVIGAILITSVQNGLAMVNANPYLYPVITGAIIFIAALVDSGRLSLMRRLERRRILA